MADPRATRTPRYVGIAAELRERILAGELAPHVLLPSERELSERHGVSRMTARQALMLLESEGRVYRRSPRGTFVAEPRVRFQIGSFTREVARLGREPRARLLGAEEQPAEPEVAASLGLGDGEAVHGFRRLRLMEDEPIAIETTWFPAALTPGVLERAGDGSLWDLLADAYDIRLERAEAVLESIVLDEEACALLEVRTASSGILLTRRTYDTQGRCVEHARDVYRADRAAFEVAASLTR